MKKIYAIIIAIVLISCSVFGVVAATVGAEKDRVNITETVIYGDKAVAEGLEITTTNYLKYKLYWKTNYTIGNDSLTKTEYTFHPTAYYGEENRHRYEGVWFDEGIEYGFNDATPVSQLEGIQKAYKELFDSADYGEEKYKTVYLKDYYDYYPIGVGFDLPNTNWYGYDGENLKGEPYDALYVSEKFSEFFKIPVLESDNVRISVEKGEDGDCYSTGTDKMNCYQLYSVGTVAQSKNRCFFTINNYKYADYENNADKLEYIDTSMIKGGYGIYSFYYFGGDSASRTGIMADRLETVYPLKEKTIVNHITLNNEETKLLLFTVENESSYLTVIDIETMTEDQRLLIDDSSMGTVYKYDDFIVTDMGESISVISVKDNVYSLEFNVQKASFIDENYQDLWNADYMDFKNGKLALVGNDFEKETGYEVCDFFVSVYDKSGLRYYGVYDNGLDINWLDSQYESNCHPADSNPNKIKWK